MNPRRLPNQCKTNQTAYPPFLSPFPLHRHWYNQIVICRLKSHSRLERGCLRSTRTASTAFMWTGVFVGPGPVRRIPLSPGTHDVRISLDGVDLSAPAQIREGRRTVLERSGGAPE